MYSKIKKTAIALCFLVGISARNYAAKHITQVKRFTQKRFAYVGRPLSKSQGSYAIVPHAKRCYTNIPSPFYYIGGLSTAQATDSGHTRIHLRYKLGIGACLASIMATQLYLNRVEATGYRGDGYRPYDCRWGAEFKKQADKALKDAYLFKRLCRSKKLDKETKKKLGASVLMALLWAQDQGKNLFKNHEDCDECVIDIEDPICHRVEDNTVLMNKYDDRLEQKVTLIRDLIGVPHPLGWEAQVPHFLYGGAKAGLAVAGGTAVAAIPVVNVVALGAGALYGLYKGLVWVDKNVVYPEKGLAEEEEYIKQQLFVRALCADEYSIKQAEKWGGYAVTAGFMAHSLFNGLSSLIGEAEAAEALEVVEALEVLEELEAAEALEVLQTIEALETVEILEAAEMLEAAGMIETSETLEILEAIRTTNLPAIKSRDLNKAMQNIATLSSNDFCSYAKQLQKMHKDRNLTPLTKEQATLMISIARKLGVYVRVDGPHQRSEHWNITHLNIGDDGKYHVPFSIK